MQQGFLELDDLSGVERVLMVTAHPDDVDFGAAGSVATWVKAGVEVAYCIVTNGDAGGSDRSVSRTEMARIRQEEQRAAAAELGVSNVSFLGYPDGRLTPSIQLRRDVSRAVRQFRPDRLVCQSPERNWDRIGASHPDHLAAGEASRMRRLSRRPQPVRSPRTARRKASSRSACGSCG